MSDPCGPPTSRRIAWLRWAMRRLGYVLRPYDMLADRRRWFWQPRQRCGWSQSTNHDSICDGGQSGGFFPTACGRDYVHPSHPLGQPPGTTEASPGGDA